MKTLVILLLLTLNASALQPPLRTQAPEFKVHYSLTYHFKEMTGFYGDELKKKDYNKYVKVIHDYAVKHRIRVTLCELCKSPWSVLRFMPTKDGNGRVAIEGMCSSCKGAEQRIRMAKAEIGSYIPYKEKPTFRYWDAVEDVLKKYGLLMEICSDCKVTLGYKDGEGVTGLSHSYCEPHYKDFVASMGVEPEVMPSEPRKGEVLA